jgi:signal transduction histidine kinase
MWFRRITLKTKILLGSLCIVLIMGITITGFIITSVQPKLLSKLQKRGIYIAQNIAVQSITPILTEKFFELTMMINEQKNQTEDIEYIFILDRNGAVLAHSFGERFPVQLKNINNITAETPFRTYYLNTEKGKITHIVIPLINGKAGSLHLGLSQKSIQQDLTDILRALVLFIFGVLIAGIVISFIFARFTAKPLSDVTSVIRRAGNRNLYQKLKISSNDEIGELGRAFNTMIDLRIEAEEALQFSKALQTAQQETSPDGLLVVDEKGKIFSFNQRFVDMWGIPEEVMRSGSEEHVLQHMSKRTVHTEEFLKRVQYLNKNRQKKNSEEIALDEGVTFNRYSVPVSGADNKYYGRVWRFRDMTKLKQFQEQLLQAQKTEAVGNLSAGIAYDFNNLLSSIIGYAHITLMKLGTFDPILPNIELIIKAANRAAELTNGLIAFSRKQTMEMKTVDLNIVINTVGTLLKKLLSGTIEQITETANGELSVLADPGKIERVLMNLAINAQYTMPGGGKLIIKADSIEIDAEYIRAHGFGEPGRYAVISVTDTGSGMDRNKTDRIFEPFPAENEVGKGIDPGLAVVYGIIKQHNGFINVRSEPGKGTTFNIYLPLVRTNSL